MTSSFSSPQERTRRTPFAARGASPTNLNQGMTGANWPAGVPRPAGNLSDYDGGPRGISPGLQSPAARTRRTAFGTPRASQPNLSAYNGGPRGISPGLQSPAARTRRTAFGTPRASQPNLSAYNGGPRGISPGMRASAGAGAAGAAPLGVARPGDVQAAPLGRARPQENVFTPARASASGASTMRPIGQPAASPAAVTAPAAPTEKVQAGVLPAVATSSAPAATTSAAASGGSYKPVEDLGDARRRAFMDAPDTATGMKRVRELLGSEAGVDPMELNKFSVAELEKRALERRNATNWVNELSNTTQAFNSESKLGQELGIKPMQLEGNPFDGSSANATAFNTDKTFGFDFAVAAGGSPLVRDVAKQAAESPLLTKDGLGNWFSSYTNGLLEEQYKSGEISKPVETLGKPLVIGNKVEGANASSYIEAFQNAGVAAPVDPKTAAVATALGGDVIGGGRRRMSGNLGFRDIASLPPLVRNTYQAAGVSR